MPFKPPSYTTYAEVLKNHGSTQIHNQMRFPTQSRALASPRSSIAHNSTSAPLKSKRRLCCFRCGHRGHFVRECRNVLTCFKCHRSGHKQNTCKEGVASTLDTRAGLESTSDSVEDLHNSAYSFVSNYARLWGFLARLYPDTFNSPLAWMKEMLFFSDKLISNLFPEQFPPPSHPCNIKISTHFIPAKNPLNSINSNENRENDFVCTHVDLGDNAVALDAGLDYFVHGSFWEGSDVMLPRESDLILDDPDVYACRSKGGDVQLTTCESFDLISVVSHDPIQLNEFSMEKVVAGKRGKSLESSFLGPLILYNSFNPLLLIKDSDNTTLNSHSQGSQDFGSSNFSNDYNYGYCGSFSAFDNNEMVNMYVGFSAYVGIAKKPEMITNQDKPKELVPPTSDVVQDQSFSQDALSVVDEVTDNGCFESDCVPSFGSVPDSTDMIHTEHEKRLLQIVVSSREGTTLEATLSEGCTILMTEKGLNIKVVSVDTLCEVIGKLGAARTLARSVAKGGRLREGVALLKAVPSDNDLGLFGGSMEIIHCVEGRDYVDAGSSALEFTCDSPDRNVVDLLEEFTYVGGQMNGAHVLNSGEESSILLCIDGLSLFDGIMCIEADGLVLLCINEKVNMMSHDQAEGPKEAELVWVEIPDYLHTPRGSPVSLSGEASSLSMDCSTLDVTPKKRGRKGKKPLDPFCMVRRGARLGSALALHHGSPLGGAIIDSGAKCSTTKSGSGYGCRWSRQVFYTGLDLTDGW